MTKSAFLALPLAAFLAPAQAATKDEVKKILKDNPEIVLDALRSNKKALFEIINQAAQEEQARRVREAEDAEKAELDAAFKNPLKPALDKDSIIRGNDDAQFTIVAYEDFECGFCVRALATTESLRKKYGSRLRMVFKHYPLPFHPKAMPAAQYMEAAARQGREKAWAFSDKLWENQHRLSEDLYKEIGKELGLDLKKLEADANSQAVKDRIEADVKEAKKFGFTGTPGFLINGVPVRGAYPLEHFEGIFEKLEKQLAEQRN